MGAGEMKIKETYKFLWKDFRNKCDQMGTDMDRFKMNQHQHLSQL
jgi:hypothetical protein